MNKGAFKAADDAGDKWGARTYFTIFLTTKNGEIGARPPFVICASSAAPAIPGVIP